MRFARKAEGELSHRHQNGAKGYLQHPGDVDQLFQRCWFWTCPALSRTTAATKCLTVRGYAGLVLPLGFRFDVDAILLGGVAHRTDCRLLATPLPADALSVAPGDVYRSERCPRECPVCHPAFETLLSSQVERPATGLLA